MKQNKKLTKLMITGLLIFSLIGLSIVTYVGNIYYLLFYGFGSIIATIFYISEELREVQKND